MSTYKGLWVQNDSKSPPNVTVTVDDLPLPVIDSDLPGAGQSFSWGYLSTWANRKMLAVSLLYHELVIEMDLPKATAHRYTVTMADTFLSDRVEKLDKQWSMTSADIQKWIQVKFPHVWAEINTKATV